MNTSTETKSPDTQVEKLLKQYKQKSSVELLAAAKAFTREANAKRKAERSPETKKKQAERLANKRKTHKSHTFWITNAEAAKLEAYMSTSPAKSISEYISLVLASSVLDSIKLKKEAVSSPAPAPVEKRSFFG